MPELTSYAGINYSHNDGTNKDTKTGLRYGIIAAHTVGQAWYDKSEPMYGTPHCPECLSDIGSYSYIEISLDEPDNIPQYNDCGDKNYYCPHCKHYIDDEYCYPDEPLGFEYLGDGYELKQIHDDSDIFVLKSPYYTYAQFCSPCAPGACHLESPLAPGHEDNKCYCLGHDWFENEQAPYLVYSVETNKPILPESVRIYRATDYEHIVWIDTYCYSISSDGNQPNGMNMYIGVVSDPDNDDLLKIYPQIDYKNFHALPDGLLKGIQNRLF